MGVEKQFTETEWDKDDRIPVQVLTDEEAFAILDAQARQRLDMLGEVFLRRWRADDLSEAFMNEHHLEFAPLHKIAEAFGRQLSSGGS